MKTLIFRTLLIIASLPGLATASFANDDSSWQHEKPSGGSYSNSNPAYKGNSNLYNSNDSQKGSDSNDSKKSVWQHGAETVQEAYRQMTNSSNSKANRISGEIKTMPK